MENLYLKDFLDHYIINMGFNRLIDIFKKTQDRYPGFSKRVKEAEALGRWEAAVGATINKHSRAIKVQDSVLWVEVDHPIWKTELHHRKRQILDILNRAQPLPTDSSTNSSITAIPIKDILFVDHLFNRSSKR